MQKQSLYMTKLALAGLFLITVAGVDDFAQAAAPQPALVAPAGTWQLDLTLHGNPQKISIKLPGALKANSFWYLLYSVTNNTAREVDFYPSVLDAKEIPEPDFDPEIEQYKHWWEKFYLKGNPFPTRAGLSDIDEQLYESIVVKTKPFKNTLSALEKDRQFLFKTAFLLVGNYGFPCVAPR